MEINIDGKKYKPSKPKARVWRELMLFDEEKSGISLVDFIDAHAEIIVKTFGNPELTADMIVENKDLDEILPLYSAVFKWFCGQLNAKIAKLPNDVPAAE